MESQMAANDRGVAMIEAEMRNGGMCLDTNNQLKVTPLCQGIPRIVFAPKEETGPRFD
jgi:hypothetical protein